MSQVQYQIEKHTLSNGMQVVVNPDPAIPAVAVNIWYDVGSGDELPGQYGWAHLFEHLMFQGSANVTSGEHLNLLQAHGGIVNATTSFDRTNYFETVPVGALDLALWMEADRLATLPDYLDQANLDTQREVVKEEKRQRYDNQPYGDAIERIISLAFPPEHPYGHTTIGSMADLDAATPEAAQAFFRKHYRPDNAVLTLVGDIQPEAAFAKVEKYFGGISSAAMLEQKLGTDSSLVSSLRKAQPQLRALHGIPRNDVTAAVPADALDFIWRIPRRDSAAYDQVQVAMDILGSGPASRLERVLIRERELAADLSMGSIELIGGNSLAMLSIHVLPGVSLQQVEEVTVELITDFLRNEPSANEISRSKVQNEREWLSNLAEYSYRADALSCYATFFDAERVNTRLDELLQVEAADVHAAAQQYLAPEQRAVLAYYQEENND